MVNHEYFNIARVGRNNQRALRRMQISMVQCATLIAPNLFYTNFHFIISPARSGTS